ncbi:MAG: hypothetical protein EAZ99_11225 [Alphaproteobacteria bacterium]|nr:hypothetical protein [Alphaproteobacteria bacterium]TAD89024.1 MAG: hypothetical protein EAZ99_11225 [Alphaproteobacteria bacterium]
MNVDAPLTALDAAPEPLRAKLEGSNISPVTLLATDYLNHFNEIVMLLDLIPDMPEILEEAQAWQPKTYVEHFRDSTIADRDLAIECWPHVPQRYRRPFDRAVETMDMLVRQILDHAEMQIRANDPDRLRHRVKAGVEALRMSIEAASGIIHGSEQTLDQREIDRLMG